MPGNGPPEGRSQRVLFVDDEADLVELFTLSLAELGYKVTGFTDPEKALAAFRSGPADYDAVVSDLSMPGMSGLDLVRNVLELRPGLPSVLASGYVRDEDAAAAKGLGVLGFAPKGYSVREMARVIDGMLRSGEAEDATRRSG